MHFPLLYTKTYYFNPTVQKVMEMRGIEPRAFHMQSERSTTELQPQMGT